MAAESSLLLTKPLGEVAHEGGLRLARGSKSYEFLRDWIKEGVRDDPTAPAAVKLEILPESRVLNAPAKSQQLVVVLHQADGSIRDVTPICYYDTSSPEIAEVNADALCTIQESGRGRGDCPLPQSRGQHPAHPSGRSARLQTGSGST